MHDNAAFERRLDDALELRDRDPDAFERLPLVIRDRAQLLADMRAMPDRRPPAIPLPDDLPPAA